MIKETWTEYNDLGDISSIKDNTGLVKKYVYGDTNKLECINFSDGRYILYKYDRNGNLINMKSHYSVTNMVYNDKDEIISKEYISDHFSYIRKYERDSLNRIIKIIHPEGITEIEYDGDSDRQVKMTVHGKVFSTHKYDSDNKIISETTDGIDYILEYDDLGNHIKSIGSNGSLFELEYDIKGNEVYSKYSIDDSISEDWYKYNENNKVVYHKGKFTKQVI